MDIVLATINAKWIHPSLALRLLKANLGDLDKDCEILEFALRQSLAEKVAPILESRPRILGLSVSIWNHLSSLELLQALDQAWDKRAGQRPVVVLGGPEISWLSEDAEIFRYADYVIRGEGEESFRSLCNGILSGNPQADRGKVPLFINRGETTVDVTAIAAAYHLYTDEDLQRKLVYVEASRGCPFACEFCQASVRKQASIKKQDSVRRNWEQQWVREFPLEPFLQAMGTLIDRGGRTFKFLDRSFNLNIDRVKKIMEFFLFRIQALETGNSGADERPLCVHFEMVPSRFPSDLKELISRFPPGTLRLELGIQTLNPEISALIRRTPGMEEALETLEFLRAETQAILHVDLIAGLPGEDINSFGKGFDQLWQLLSGAGKPGLHPFEIQLGILKCLGGTPIARHNETHGMAYSALPPYEVIESAALATGELGKIKNFARFWELIVNRNPFPDLIPLLLPPGEPAFGRFMALSGSLLDRFGRNWGIEKRELKQYLDSYAQSGAGN